MQLIWLSVKPVCEQFVLAKGSLELAHLAYYLSEGSELLQRLAEDEEMLQRAKQVRGSGHERVVSFLSPCLRWTVLQMMDAAIEGTWRMTVLSFETCRALWRLLPVSRQASVMWS